MKKLFFSFLVIIGLGAGSVSSSLQAMQNVPVPQVVDNRSWATASVVGVLWLGWTFAPILKKIFFKSSLEKEERQDFEKLMIEGKEKSFSQERVEILTKKYIKKMCLDHLSIKCLVKNSPLTKKMPGLTFPDFVKDIQQVKFFHNHKIVLNENFVKNMSQQELSFVIAHELAHIKNGDSQTTLKQLFISLGVRALSGILLLPLVVYSNNVVGVKGLVIFQTHVALNSLIEGVENFAQRQQEKRADLTAVKAIGNSRGAVRFFDRERKRNVLLIEEVKKGVVKDISTIKDVELGKFDDQGNNLFDNGHPKLTERLAYCQAAQV